MNQADRKKYWNDDYFKYWKSRVDESNADKNCASNLNAQDSMTATDEGYIDALQILNIHKQHRTLEVGCGFGRSLPYLCAKSGQVDAVDISEAMIRESKAQTNGLTNLNLIVSEAEKMPLPSDIYDSLICFSVFDALEQQAALIEFNRVCRIGARVLLTGKNDDYFDDDEKASVAEVRAREKGHPNSFTDVRLLIKNISSFGFKVLEERYFLRRGDTATNVFSVEMPSHFYEYTVVLEKISPVTATTIISSSYSKTSQRMKHS